MVASDGYSLAARAVARKHWEYHAGRSAATNDRGACPPDTRIATRLTRGSLPGPYGVEDLVAGRGMPHKRAP